MEHIQLRLYRLTASGLPQDNGTICNLCVEGVTPKDTFEPTTLCVRLYSNIYVKPKDTLFPTRIYRYEEDAWRFWQGQLAENGVD